MQVYVKTICQYFKLSSQNWQNCCENVPTDEEIILKSFSNVWENVISNWTIIRIKSVIVIKNTLDKIYKEDVCIFYSSLWDSGQWPLGASVSAPIVRKNLMVENGWFSRATLLVLAGMQTKWEKEARKGTHSVRACLQPLLTRLYLLKVSITY